MLIYGFIQATHSYNYSILQVKAFVAGYEAVVIGITPYTARSTEYNWSKFWPPMEATLAGWPEIWGGGQV